MIHFWADWNPLDPGMFHVFEEVQQAVGDQVGLARVQVGPPENTELCRWLGIVQVPTVLYVFRNQVIDVKVGYSKNRLVGHVMMLMQACNAAGPEMPVMVPESPAGNGPWMTSGPNAQQPQFAPPNYPHPGAPGGPWANMEPQASGLASPSFGRPVQEMNYPNGMPPGGDGRPVMRFGLFAPQPTAPIVAERQKKSWLSRWLGLD